MVRRDGHPRSPSSTTRSLIDAVAAPRALPVEEPADEEPEELYDDEESDEELEASEAEPEGPEGAEGKEEDDKDAESRRRRRSRGRRGGRRRNGKAAAAGAPATAEPAEEEDDDEEAWREEPAEEPVPVAAPAPRRIAPVPSPSRYVISPSEVESDGARDHHLGPRPPARRATSARSPCSSTSRTSPSASATPQTSKFDINLVLERLLEKGKIIVKKAYADWERYSDYKRPFHEAAIELIEIPQKRYSGKNSRRHPHGASTRWTWPTPRSTSTPS